MTTQITVTGVQEIVRRMSAYPAELKKQVNVSMEASLVTLKQYVPKYPPPPAGSSYERTGTLGKSLGSNKDTGGNKGAASVYQIKSMGSGVEGVFGTNLDYAEYVIGEGTQARWNAGRWWTLKTVAERAQSKIEAIWNQCVAVLAAFLDK